MMKPVWLIALASVAGLGCSGGSAPPPGAGVNPYDQRAPLIDSSQPPAAKQPGTTGMGSRPSAGGHSGSQRTMTTQIIEIDPEDEPTGPSLPFEDYVLWTRQVAAQLNTMARLYAAMAADGDVQSRVPQWSDACFELEKAYGEAVRTPRPSAETSQKLEASALKELDEAIQHAEAAQAEASGVEGEIYIFIEYGRKLSQRFRGTTPSP